jgi:hypothetical protein
MTRKRLHHSAAIICGAITAFVVLGGCTYTAVWTSPTCKYTATGTAGGVSLSQPAAGRPLTLQVTQSYPGTVQYTGAVTISGTTYNKKISQTSPPSVYLSASEVATYKGKEFKVTGKASSALGSVSGTYSCTIR